MQAVNDVMLMMSLGALQTVFNDGFWKDTLRVLNRKSYTISEIDVLKIFPPEEAVQNVH